MSRLLVVSLHTTGEAGGEEALWEASTMAQEVHSSEESHPQLSNLGKRVEENTLENREPPVEEGPPP